MLNILLINGTHIILNHTFILHYSHVILMRLTGLPEIYIFT